MKAYLTILQKAHDHPPLEEGRAGHYTSEDKVAFLEKFLKANLSEIVFAKEHGLYSTAIGAFKKALIKGSLGTGHEKLIEDLEALGASRCRRKGTKTGAKL